MRYHVCIIDSFYRHGISSWTLTLSSVEDALSMITGAKIELKSSDESIRVFKLNTGSHTERTRILIMNESHSLFNINALYDYDVLDNAKLSIEFREGVHDIASKIIKQAEEAR